MFAKYIFIPHTFVENDVLDFMDFISNIEQQFCCTTLLKTLIFSYINE